MKKVIALCLLLITVLSLFGCEANPGKFTDTIYESKIKIAGKSGPKVQYCIREPEKYDFYSYEYNEDAVFTDKEIKQLTKGFSFVEEKVFENDEFPFNLSDEKDRKVYKYKKDDIELVLLDDRYCYILPNCPFCSSEKEYEESEETSKKLYGEVIDILGITVNKNDEYRFSIYDKYTESDKETGKSVNTCNFYVHKVYNGIMNLGESFEYFHNKNGCYFYGKKEKISKGDKINEQIITGEELIEVYEDRLTNSSIYYNNTAPALKHSCQLYYRSEYDEDEKKWKCRLEWVIVFDTPAIPDFSFSPRGSNTDYVSFDAITGDLGWSLRDIW